MVRRGDVSSLGRGLLAPICSARSRQCRKHPVISPWSEQCVDKSSLQHRDQDLNSRHDNARHHANDKSPSDRQTRFNRHRMPPLRTVEVECVAVAKLTTAGQSPHQIVTQFPVSADHDGTFWTRTPFAIKNQAAPAAQQLQQRVDDWRGSGVNAGDGR
jgi:hypothetical protein